MLKVLIITKKHLYITLGIIAALIVGILMLVILTKSSETFSENYKYAYKKITAEEAKILISKNKDLTILDIRSEKEFLNGHIPRAALIPYNIVKKQYVHLDKNKKYLVYCKTGKKSEKIAKTLSNNGFPRVYVLIGGIEKWNYDLVK
ncbi:Rhodanese-related sulfurtransferase [Caminicella sporogenes DSM 14501]|uniref:Rhodanese-related sulfurtransferase n=1 Tax=Caminicella sporogenes DSM 14501 TaxID=1121266 RepID=A0A1M6SFN3_9FIRM|nr:rhodanese-like domain-containing protein [Caminicella sporogenes]SHK43533.1 Rhodanese-related sulfurtransferase [Caminicella sporogenes DSM 14501]